VIDPDYAKTQSIIVLVLCNSRHWKSKSHELKVIVELLFSGAHSVLIHSPLPTPQNPARKEWKIWVIDVNIEKTSRNNSSRNCLNKSIEMTAYNLLDLVLMFVLMSVHQ